MSWDCRQGRGSADADLDLNLNLCLLAHFHGFAEYVAQEDGITGLDDELVVGSWNSRILHASCNRDTASP
jgi:hypothetical protein